MAVSAPIPRRGSAQSPFIDLTSCDRIIIVEDEDTIEEKDHNHTSEGETAIPPNVSPSEEEEILWGWQIEAQPTEETPLQRLLSRKRKHRSESGGYHSDQEVRIEAGEPYISDSEEEGVQKRLKAADHLIVWDAP
jgi:hypothetical protein